ncbi:hypothetical protein SODALDRAFT_362012 [Sodiomyces alkalinus F11]|uniref:Uncharacterized protein n=1 Tax=Sodiomyces alkalinus (strain CBS 110278 / VKM F-3762 / F11) TaxID=1314773 RepID=A0A3N2PP81_SODAK|nr:hypothetical protein SODALDRAFT_362012 [Sodiomyces alkalinus F11]ROT36234.1 hypothetical protein SODALDRAFT_362012 [Sodiomyces alkalinus F11]
MPYVGAETACCMFSVGKRKELQGTSRNYGGPTHGGWEKKTFSETVSDLLPLKNPFFYDFSSERFTPTEWSRTTWTTQLLSRSRGSKFSTRQRGEYAVLKKFDSQLFRHVCQTGVDFHRRSSETADMADVGCPTLDAQEPTGLTARDAIDTLKGLEAHKNTDSKKHGRLYTPASVTVLSVLSGLGGVDDLPVRAIKRWTKWAVWHRPDAMIVQFRGGDNLNVGSRSIGEFVHTYSQLEYLACSDTRRKDEITLRQLLDDFGRTPDYGTHGVSKASNYMILFAYEVWRTAQHYTMPMPGPLVCPAKMSSELRAPEHFHAEQRPTEYSLKIHHPGHIRTYL